MKTKLKNLNATLTYCLEEMYDAEKRIQSELAPLSKQVSSSSLAKLLKGYVDAAADKRTKLKRVFSYLLAGPFENKSRITKAVFSDMEDIKEISGPPVVRDLLFARALRGLAQHKARVYESASGLAGRLELEKVDELLEEIYGWETETVESLSKLEASLTVVLQKETIKSKSS